MGSVASGGGGWTREVFPNYEGEGRVEYVFNPSPRASTIHVGAYHVVPNIEIVIPNKDVWAFPKQTDYTHTFFVRPDCGYRRPAWFHRGFLYQLRGPKTKQKSPRKSIFNGPQANQMGKVSTKEPRPT